MDSAGKVACQPFCQTRNGGVTQLAPPPPLPPPYTHPPPTQTGTLKDGPADLMAGRDLESSDTNPALDPSEQANITHREGFGSDMSGQGGSSTGERLHAVTLGVCALL